MKKALVASLPDPSGNPRPNRAIKLLYNMGFEVHTLSPRLKYKMKEVTLTFEINPSEISNSFKIFRRLLLLINSLAGIFKLGISFFHKTYSLIWKIKDQEERLKNEYYNLIIVEDLTLLPFFVKNYTNKSKIILDAREYYPKEMEGSFYFRHIVAPEKRHLCKLLLKKIDGFYTVSNGLAELFEREFSIRPEVIRSTPYYNKVKYKPIKDFPVKLVHHGVANRDRLLENMIFVLAGLEGRYTLDFYLTGDENYIRELKVLGHKSKNVNFHDPVPFSEINEMLCSYDIGFYFLVPAGFNTKFNLPNKFFEFIQAGLGVVIGPSPEMSLIAQEFGVGIISDDFTVQSMIKTLKSKSLKDLNLIKNNSIEVALQLSWETESKKLESIIKNLMV
ncbi:glycosyltransferase family protein [Aquirufa rosea]|uniref:Glycosyltransferase n=1 Tax=Aquirufa rosea TaxID=2509241 RepID=A0A4Q1BYS8_9BACT|nr:glycosyltransferase [Aquirufa rosea]RXK48274.1 glycosyltransferase [Aquirufa rosea]